MWLVWTTNGVEKKEDLKFTSVAISEYTNLDVMTASNTIIKGEAKAYAARAMAQRSHDMTIVAEAVRELLEGVRKEIQALGSIAQLISSEHYGMNRLSKVDSYSVSSGGTDENTTTKAEEL